MPRDWRSGVSRLAPVLHRVTPIRPRTENSLFRETRVQYDYDNRGQLEGANYAGLADESYGYDDNRTNADAFGAAFQWTGVFRDQVTGLQWNRARWYNPAIQRWMSEDPSGLGPDENPHRYVHNAPTTWVDPDGREAQPAGHTTPSDPWWNDSWRDWFYPWSWGASWGDAIGDFGSSVYYIDTDFEANRQLGTNAISREGTADPCPDDYRSHQRMGQFSETTIKGAVNAYGQLPGTVVGMATAVGVGVVIRNARLAGKVHPVTKIPFNADGFPDFSLVSTRTVKIKQAGNYTTDFAAANKAAGLDCTPSGFTWHHHQDGTTMQLVPIDIHKKTGHTGGVGLHGDAK